MANPCPLCDGPLVVQPGGKPLGEGVDSHAECRESCPRCRIGLTNATGPSRTFIREDWKEGLWRSSTATRLETVIEHSLNRQARPKKKRRLAHERSEDLVTWNVFSWLEDRGLLNDLLTSLGRDGSSGVQVFYWGYNDRHPLPGGLDLERLLVDRFRESSRSPSEPDVILTSDKDVVFVEAKLGSPNEHRPNDARTDKYVLAVPDWFVEPEVVRAAGYYELTRNWAIGAAMATELGRTFTLVNLVRASDEKGIAESFGRVLRPKGVFQRRTWEELAALDPFMTACLRRQTLHFQPAFPGLSDES